MALKMQSQQLTSSRVVASRTVPFKAGVCRRSVVAVRAAAQTQSARDNLGFELMRDGIKKASADTLLTPRFYTTGVLHSVPYGSLVAAVAVNTM